MPAPVRYPNGVTNVGPTSPLAQLGTLDPRKYSVFWEDFHNYTAGDWTITETGTGTRDIANENHGVLVVTNGAVDDNANFLQWSGNTDASTTETFKFVAGKPLWFSARIKVSDATQSDYVVGLQITDTTPLAVTDGVYFRKDDGDANIDFVVIKDSTSTEAAAVATATTSYQVLSFYYDGVASIAYYVDDVQVGTSVTTNLVDDEELTVSFGVQNGEAVAKALSVDYLLVVNTR